MTLERLVLYTDGGSRARKKRYAAASAILTDGKKILREKGWYLGEMTNNQAEYTALLRGMEMASFHGPQELICISDSQLIVRQLSGDYKVKNASLKLLYEKVKELEAGFGLVLYVHADREHPMIRLADSLLNKILDEKCD